MPKSVDRDGEGRRGWWARLTPKANPESVIDRYGKGDTPVAAAQRARERSDPADYAETRCALAAGKLGCARSALTRRCSGTLGLVCAPQLFAQAAVATAAGVADRSRGRGQPLTAARAQLRAGGRHVAVPAVMLLDGHRDQDARDRADDLVVVLGEGCGEFRFQLRERRHRNLGHHPIIAHRSER